LTHTKINSILDLDATVGRGEEMANKTISSGLDYNIDSLEERKNKVEEIIGKNDTDLITYFDDYYNPSLTQNSRLSENDPMCKQLERIADYLLYAENKEKRKEQHGDDFHIDVSSKKKEIPIGNIFHTQDEEDSSIQSFKLYRKVKVTNEDREQFEELKDTGRLIERLKTMIDTGVDSNGNKIDEDAMRKIKWYLIEIRKDEVAIKEILKGYIRFKRLSPEGGEADFSGFCFDNIKHVSTLFYNYSKLKQSSFDDTHGYLKIILEVFENIISGIKFEDYVYDIFIWKIDGLKRKQISYNIKEKYGIEVSERMISEITRNTIPQMIVENYKNNYEDWVYIFKIKGIYKVCSKCSHTKLQSEFGINNRSKDGLNSVCKECRKSK
jgi:hypothetical protein